MDQNTFYLVLIILLVALSSGLFYYLNQLADIIRKCCEKNSPGNTGECIISYPADSIGAADPNILSNADGTTVPLSYDPDVESGIVVPLRADLTTMGCTVKVVIQSTDPDFAIGFFPNQHNWFGRGISQLEWEFFTYGPGVADGIINLSGSGTGTINVYENGSDVPAKTIIVDLN